MVCKKIILSSMLSSLVLTGCSQVEDATGVDLDGKEDTEESVESEGAKVGTETVSNIGELNLANVLRIKIPAALVNKSASLTATGKKSYEACEIGRVLNDGLQGIMSMGNMFCHLEIEKDRIEFGKKYEIKI